jgi:predicted O-linked N-acetylglucosamine transferase (SPINDLY family)
MAAQQQPPPPMNRRQRRAAGRQRPAPGAGTEAAKAAANRKDYAAAIVLADEVLADAPGDIEARVVRAVARQHGGDPAGAEADYLHAVKAAPGHPIAALNLGALHLSRGENGAAAALFDAVLADRPGMFEALLNRGVVHQLAGESRLAQDCFDAAAKARPDAPEPHWRLSELHRFANRLDLAIAAGAKAVALAPDNAHALAHLVYARMRACDWAGLEDQLAQLRAAVEARLDRGLTSPLRPFVAMAAYDDAGFNLRVAQSESRRIAGRMQPIRDALGASEQRRHSGPIRVGYLSAGFRDHPTAHLTRRLYKLHDRARFTVVGLALGADDGSHYRRDIATDCDRFIDLVGLDAGAAAQRVREAGIDILVDLHGYLQDNRIGLLAARPAPVQVNYLGFPGTTGADFHDYIICDRTIVPRGEERHYAETPVFMPHCYQVNDPAQDQAIHRPSRADAGLAEGAVVFASFNVNYKIDPVMFGAWSTILNRVPGSVLWLLKSSDLAARNLQREAEDRGVDGGRIVFADLAPKAAHMARLPLADLGLDTRICNGHTTTTDMLCAGVPVVTLRGRHFASRVASSLLINDGLEDLVTTTLDAYVERAVTLANDRGALAAVRARVTANRKSHPLFNVEAYVRDLEAAYEAMWRRHCAGLPRQPIEVAAS